MVKKGLHFTLVAFLVFGVVFFSGCRRSGGLNRAEFAIDYVTEVLDLNEAQQEQLNRIKDELVEKGRQMHADREAMHDEITVQLQSEEIDQERLKKLIADKRAQMNEMIDLMIVHLVEFHKTLTPEQRTKLVAKLESFSKWHRHGWE